MGLWYIKEKRYYMWNEEGKAEGGKRKLTRKKLQSVRGVSFKNV